jgi:transcriptional regulator with XRE-family HTH domain
MEFKDFKKQALTKPGVKAEYERLAHAYELRRKLIKIRLASGLTQAQMARALNTQKSNISRLENVNSRNSPTLSTIERYARAAGYTVDINFIPEEQAPPG